MKTGHERLSALAKYVDLSTLDWGAEVEGVWVGGVFHSRWCTTDYNRLNEAGTRQVCKLRVEEAFNSSCTDFARWLAAGWGAEGQRLAKTLQLVEALENSEDLYKSYIRCYEALGGDAHLQPRRYNAELLDAVGVKRDELATQISELGLAWFNALAARAGVRTRIHSMLRDLSSEVPSGFSSKVYSAWRTTSNASAFIKKLESTGMAKGSGLEGKLDVVYAELEEYYSEAYADQTPFIVFWPNLTRTVYVDGMESKKILERLPEATVLEAGTALVCSRALAEHLATRLGVEVAETSCGSLNKEQLNIAIKLRQDSSYWWSEAIEVAAQI